MAFGRARTPDPAISPANKIEAETTPRPPALTAWALMPLLASPSQPSFLVTCCSPLKIRYNVFEMLTSYVFHPLILLYIPSLILHLYMMLKFITSLPNFLAHEILHHLPLNIQRKREGNVIHVWVACNPSITVNNATCQSCLLCQKTKRTKTFRPVQKLLLLLKNYTAFFSELFSVFPLVVGTFFHKWAMILSMYVPLL